MDTIEIFERTRQVRKYFNLSQADFGKKLGVSRSVINNMEMNILAKPELKTSLLKLICSVFGVSEEWLFNGTGEMFLETTADYIDKIALEHNLDDLDMQIINTYLELEKDDRQVIKKYLHRLATNITENDIEKEMDEIRKELIEEKKAKAKLSASSSTDLGKEKDA